MLSFRSALIAGAALLLATPVIAQTPGQRIVIENAGSSPRQEGLVRVQTNINFFLTGPTGESEEAQEIA